MMHYGFCRKHADQMGEGGCPECAMDHQQAEILELRAQLQAAEAMVDADNERLHQATLRERELQAEVARLKSKSDEGNAFLKRLAVDGGFIVSTGNLTSAEMATAFNDGRMFVDGDSLGYVISPGDGVLRTATEAALRWAWEHYERPHHPDPESLVRDGLKALLGNNETNTNNQGEINA